MFSSGDMLLTYLVVTQKNDSWMVGYQQLSILFHFTINRKSRPAIWQSGLQLDAICSNAACSAFKGSQWMWCLGGDWKGWQCTVSGMGAERFVHSIFSVVYVYL